MKTGYIVFTSIVSALCATVLLLSFLAAPNVQAQAGPSYPDAPNYQFMPYIAKDAQTPKKFKSGIHLGNRNDDWLVNGEDKFLVRLRGTTAGKWPASVVVLSDQLYTLYRYDTPGEPNPLCRVVSAGIKSPHLYDYLTEAIEQGTKVIIRIHPSPGNFRDYNTTSAAPSPERHLTRADDVPAGVNYCGQDQQRKIEAYRDVRDIVNEMKEIYELNTNSEHRWSPESFYFEPANEPRHWVHRMGLWSECQQR